MNNKRYFITGTDTGIGKTYTAIQMLQKFNTENYSTVALKPVASGCQMINGQLCNEDALLLQQAASIDLAYEEVNPFALEEPIAPHIAATKIGIELTATMIAEAINNTLRRNADIALVEGVGGWLVPLNHTETLAHVVKRCDLEVILVVGMRLGCLNHALLTYKAILASGVPVAGWIANCIDPQMECCEENIETLKGWIDVPCWGIFEYSVDSTVATVLPSMHNYIAMVDRV